MGNEVEFKQTVL